MAKRERLRLWLKTSPLVAPMKKLVPDVVKRGLLNVLVRGVDGTIELNHGMVLRYDLSDSYWSSYSRDIRSYEPEMWFIADHFFESDTIFVDCGANIGLWSCYAAHKIKSKYQVIAVEPGYSVLPRLKQNLELNGGDVTLLEEAVWSKSGISKTFMVYAGHASSSLIIDNQKRRLLRTISVQTVCIDDIVRRALNQAPDASRIVIKLDVEGAEREALAGAMHTLLHLNTLIIYEDHGQDRASENTGYVMQMGLHVYYIDMIEERTRCVEIVNRDQLEGIKTNTGKGYNFVACKPGTRFDAAFAELARGVLP